MLKTFPETSIRYRVHANCNNSMALRLLQKFMVAHDPLQKAVVHIEGQSCIVSSNSIHEKNAPMHDTVKERQGSHAYEKSLYAQDATRTYLMSWFSAMEKYTDREVIKVQVCKTLSRQQQPCMSFFNVFATESFIFSHKNTIGTHNIYRIIKDDHQIFSVYKIAFLKFSCKNVFKYCTIPIRYCFSVRNDDTLVVASYCW